MNNNLNLDSLNDRQKIWLSQISYLNINEQGRKLITNGGINLYELKNYLSDPNKPFVGNAGMGEKFFNFFASKATGGQEIPSQLEVLNSLIACGLGNLKIIDISNQQNFFSSGFTAMTFEDSFGNTGISYRGSDINFSEGAIRDWVESDILEYFKSDSTQRKEALEYFERNKNPNGKNYVYGHSLGGNLTSHVYAENYNEISQAFTINGNPINQKLLDTQEKVDAFNDPKKYSCNVICGDMVGHLKSCKSYENNVNYIRNNETKKNTIIGSHLVQSSTFDENGNFVKVSKEEMKEKMGTVKVFFMNLFKSIRETINKIEYKFSNNKQAFNEYKNDLSNSFEAKFEELGYENEKTNLDEFKKIANKAELEEVEKIKNKIMYQQLDSDIQIQKEEMMSDMVVENEVSVRTR